MKFNKRKGKPTIQISSRITIEDREILKANNVTIREAIEYYIDNDLNPYGRQRKKLKEYQAELKQIEEAEARKSDVLKEIENLKKSIGYIEINQLEVSPEAKSKAQAYLRYYKREKEKYHNIKEWIMDNKQKIEPQALDVDLTFEKFSELIEHYYNITDKEIKENNPVKPRLEYDEIVISANVSAECKKQLNYAITRANKHLKGFKKYNNDLNNYIKSNDDFISNYCSKCGLEKDKFVNLMIEAYKNRFNNK